MPAEDTKCRLMRHRQAGQNRARMPESPTLHHFFLTFPMNSKLPTFLCCLLTLTWFRPLIAETRDGLSKIPNDFQAGLDYAMQFERHFGLVKDPKIQNRLKEIGYKVAAASNQTNTFFVFNVIDLADPNAVALPGGFIFFTRGILDLGLSDEELAHIIGHECSHVLDGHHASLQTKAGMLSLLQFATIFAAAFASANNSSSAPATATLGSPDNRSSSTGQHVAAAIVTSSLVTNLMLLKYVREYEMEADRHGRLMACGAGFGPGGSEGMLEKLLSRSYQRPGMGILRSHPYLEDRIRVAQTEGAQLQLNPTPRTADDYRQRVQEVFFYRATEFWNVIRGPQADYLLRNAYDAMPEGPLADDCKWQSLVWKEKLEQHTSFRQRDYGYFVDAYGEILREFPNTNLKDMVQARITYCQQRRDKVMPEHMRKAELETIVPSFGEYFLKNYPNHNKTAHVQFKLAREYRKGRKYDESAETIVAFLKRPEAREYTRQVQEEFLLLLEKIKKIEPAYSYFLILEESKKKEAIADGIRALIKRVELIMELGEFKERHPNNVFLKELDERLLELSGQAMVQARLMLGERRYHEAAAEFYNVNHYSPDPKQAELARDELRELQQLRK